MFRSRKAEPQRPGFRGVWAAAVTPHRREGYEADFAATLELVDRLGRSGVDGIVLLGATGEFLNIKPDDRQRLIHLAVKRSSVPIIAGVGHSTLDTAIRLAGEAADSGAAGVLLMPPYFYRYGDAEILEFFRLFALAIGGVVPILIYNIPGFSNPVSIENARELLLSGDFAGIKDSSGDPAYFDALAAMKADADFSLLCGNDRLIARAHRAGAEGVVSGVACAAPEIVLKLYSALEADDAPLAALLESHLADLIAWLDRFPVPVGIAAATEARGLSVGPTAVPLTPDQFDALEEFKAWFGPWLAAIQQIAPSQTARPK